MIRASELSIPPAPVPYFRRRLAELVAQGRAAIREKGRPDAEEVRRTRAITRMTWTFVTRLAVMLDALVYYSPAGRRLSFRRVNPRPALNGKVYVPPLPADAKFVGRYAYPYPRRDFRRDLAEVMQEGGKA